jgi:Methyltransferase domain/C-methyltransferase C-terminal domain
MSHLTPRQFVCRSCGCDRVRLFYEAPSVPVNSVLLLSSREEAVRFPTGDIKLGLCEVCGFVYNTSFDPRLVEYSSRCEETQGFSPYFRAWHEGLARKLIDRYSLHSKKIVEIGCGKGEFLVLLCDLGGNHGVGYDPAYVPERISPAFASRIDFIPHLYSESDSAVCADFICCKMTLEHVAETAGFVKMVRRSLGDSYSTYVFFQVPDVVRVLEEKAFWDVYYEHCSYFSLGSLARLFREAGFDVLDLGREYHGQYVTIEARTGAGTGALLAAENDLEAVKALVESFAIKVPRRIAEWRKKLNNFRERGMKTVVWGAGSKGVTFLATVDVPDAVKYVVDINPHMSGHFMAKTGIEIINCSALHAYRPDIVIIMNPVYREEITNELAIYGLRPEVMVVDAA